MQDNRSMWISEENEATFVSLTDVFYGFQIPRLNEEFRMRKFSKKR